MKRKVLEIVYLTEDEEIDLFLIKDSYEKNGYECIMEKTLVEDDSSNYSIFLAFRKEE